MMMICIATVDGDVDDAGDDDDDLQMERTTTTGAGLPKGAFTAS